MGPRALGVACVAAACLAAGSFAGAATAQPPDDPAPQTHGLDDGAAVPLVAEAGPRQTPDTGGSGETTDSTDAGGSTGGPGGEGTTDTGEPAGTGETTPGASGEGTTEPTDGGVVSDPVLEPTFGPPGTRVTVTQETGGCGSFEAWFEGVGSASDTTSPGGVSEAEFTIPDGMAPRELTVRTTACGTTGTAMFQVTEPSDEQPTTTSRGGATPPTTLPPPETVEECEQAAAEAEAQLVYEPRRRMVTDRTYEVQAALSLDDLPPDVTFESPTTSVLVPDARCAVSAHLTGPDFTIDPPDPQPQAFLGTRTLVWQWDVRPRHTGDLELALRIQAEVVEAGRTVPGREILKEAVVDVDAAPVSAWTRLVDWTRDVFGHPMVPVVLVPLAGLAIAAGRRRFGRAPTGGAASGAAAPGSPAPADPGGSGAGSGAERTKDDQRTPDDRRAQDDRPTRDAGPTRDSAPRHRRATTRRWRPHHRPRPSGTGGGGP